jgi:hypothetical protein
MRQQQQGCWVPPLSNNHGGRVGFGCCTCFACCLFRYNQPFYNQPGSTLADLALDLGVLASIEANVFTTCDTVYNVVQTRLGLVESGPVSSVSDRYCSERL